MAEPLVPLPAPFLLDDRTIATLDRLGPVLFRFWRAVDLIIRRSQNGSLPPWIAAIAARMDEAPPPLLLCPALTLSAGQLLLTSLGRRTAGIERAGRIQEVHGGMGEAVAGGPRGILDSLEATGGQTSIENEPMGSDLWMALLCAAPLQSLWARELRSSNLRFLRDLLPFTWIVDPSPLPHQAVLPRLKVRSFAELDDPGSGLPHLALKPALESEAPAEWIIRSRVPAQDWSRALQRALAGYPEHPWLLQEVVESDRAVQPAWKGKSGTMEEISGDVSLRAYYVELGGKVTTTGIVAEIGEGRKEGEKEKGERPEKLAVLAPCLAGKATS